MVEAGKLEGLSDKFGVLVIGGTSGAIEEKKKHDFVGVVRRFSCKKIIAISVTSCLLRGVKTFQTV